MLAQPINRGGLFMFFSICRGIRFGVRWMGGDNAFAWEPLPSSAAGSQPSEEGGVEEEGADRR
jgi:hypothetical protein